MAKVYCLSSTSVFLHKAFLPVMKAMRDLGVHVTALGPIDGGTGQLEGEGFPFIPVQHYHRKSANPLHDVSLLRELLRIYREGRPDLVLHFTIKANVYGTMAARLAGCKSICTVTGLGWLFTEKSLKTVVGGAGYKILYRISFSCVEHVVLLNQDDRDFFLRNGLVDPHKCVIIPGQGVDTKRFTDEIWTRNSENGEKGTIFLLMGRMLKDKGIYEYLEAARIVKKLHPEARFQLLGPIDLENRAAIPEQRIREWEQSGLVEYMGATDDVRPFLAQSDAVVLPSYREGIPTALLEAMAMGKPIITTDAPGCREVVEDGANGFLVRAKDMKALADSFQRFMDLPRDRREEMGRNGRAKAVNNFDEGIVTDRYMGLIRRALNL